MPTPGRVRLYLNDTNEATLSIPLTECTTFANKPLKWLRFLGFAIYGREGRLSTSMDGPELDYTAQIEARSYYFISDDKPCFADAAAIDDRTSNTSDLSSARKDFRRRVIDRDGTCVLNGDPKELCDACHFIPHSKGDSYMSNLFNHRHEVYGLVDPLDDINDSRNGILLNVLFHRALGTGDIAFLMTPNFALTVDDIPYHQPPSGGSPARRLTLQHIRPSRISSTTVSREGPHNSDARQPQDVDQWPLAIIVDLCYASAVLRAWGPQTFIEHVWADCYYKSGVGGDDDKDASRDPTPRVPQNQPTQTRSVTKAQEAVDPVDQRSVGDMLDVVLILWKRAAREAQDERRVPSSDAVDISDNKNKVQAWLQSMEESTL